MEDTGSINTDITTMDTKNHKATQRIP